MYEVKDSYFFIADTQTTLIFGITGVLLLLLLGMGFYFVIKKR